MRRGASSLRGLQGLGTLWPWAQAGWKMGNLPRPQCPCGGGGGPQAHRPPRRLQKLEEQDRRALSIKEQLQREHRFLKRRLEQLSVQSLERVRTDSTGSAVSTDDSEQGGDTWAALTGPWLGHVLPAAPRWEAGTVGLAREAAWGRGGSGSDSSGQRMPT